MKNPEEPMYMLKARHLAPMYGIARQRKELLDTMAKIPIGPRLGYRIVKVMVREATR